VVVGVEPAGVTSIDVVVVGEGMTMPEGGSDTTPMDEVSVGPLGWLRGTKMIPKIPMAINAKETDHQSFCVRRFLLRDVTSPNLV
jgi:hypothetical protein